MVPVPLIFQPSMTKLDCKTGRNKSTNTVILFLFLIGSCHEATEKFMLQVMLSGKEEGVRHWKTLLKYTKIIYRVMTSFTRFSKLKERGGREIATSIPSLHISYTSSSPLSSRCPVLLTAHNGLDIKTKLSTLRDSPS